MKTIKIFVASSGELSEERDEIVSILNTINKSYPDLKLEAIKWETDIPSGSYDKKRIQDEINPLLNDSDIVILLIYTKLGKFTLEEYELAKDKKKKIFIYYKIGFLDNKDEITNHKKVLVFNHKIQKENPHLFKQFTNIDQFINIVTEDLNLYFSILKSDDVDKPTKPSKQTKESIAQEIIPKPQKDEEIQEITDEEKPLSFYMVNKAVSDFWTVEDLLGYETYARAIAQPILDSTTKPPLTIAVQAPWGHGKTSLMRMIQKLLEEKKPTAKSDKKKNNNTDRLQFNQLFSCLDEEEEKKEGSSNMLKLDGKYVPTVWFNPLYYQNSEQIWAGMAHAILNQLSDKMKSPLKSEEFWLRLQWKLLNKHAIRKDFHKMIFEDFIPKAVCYLIVGIISATIFGIYAIKNPTYLVWSASGGIPIVLSFIHFLIKKKFAEKWTLRDKFKTYVQEPDYEGKMGYLYLVDSDIDRALKLLAGTHTIAVFVDDLDRCRPDVVCEIMMAINQFISLPNRNIIFILGMDSKKVAEALETSLDHKENTSVQPTDHEKSFGWHFLEKFIQLPFFIPHLSKEIITSYLETLLVHSKPKEETKEPDLEKIKDYKKRIQETTDAEGLVLIAQQVKSEVPSEVNKEIERELSSKASELLKDPEGEELRRLAETAIEDQEYSPRAVKRFLNLVRFLRQIQLVRGTGDMSESSRLIVTRTAHLVLNWPEILLWLQGNESHRTKDGEKIVPIEKLEDIAREAKVFKDWSSQVHNTWGEEKAHILADPSFYEFVKRTIEKPPSLLDIYKSKQL